MNKDLLCIICKKPVKWKGLCKEHYYDEYNIKNKEKIKIVNKKYRERYHFFGPISKEEWILKKKQTKVLEKETTKKYNLINCNKLRILQTNWKKKNWTKIKLKHKEKLKNNVQYMISHKMRTKLGSYFYNCKINKWNTTSKILGCDFKFFQKYIEKKFKPNMNWQNWTFYGWHLDHIKPISSFDLTKKTEQKKCFHYTNLQPLWWEDNLKKNNRYI